MAASVADMGTLLELGDTIDTDRAQLLIDLATDLCTSVVDPVPDNARAVVLSMAMRAYTNPTGVQAQTIGPESVQYGPTGAGGMYMTKRELSALRRIAGRGGAFSVDPTADDAGTELYPWDLNIWWLWGDGVFSSMDETDPAEMGMWS